MAEQVTIDQLAQMVMDGLQEYADLAADELKKCVRAASTSVKKEVQQNAPVDTGRYKASWAVTKQKEDSSSIELVVHSKKHYRLTHLLEHGHAKRGGGRVAAKVHIAPAEALGERELMQNIERALQK